MSLLGFHTGTDPYCGHLFRFDLGGISALERREAVGISIKRIKPGKEQDKKRKDASENLVLCFCRIYNVDVLLRYSGTSSFLGSAKLEMGERIMKVAVEHKFLESNRPRRGHISSTTAVSDPQLF